MAGLYPSRNFCIHVSGGISSRVSFAFSVDQRVMELFTAGLLATFFSESRKGSWDGVYGGFMCRCLIVSNELRNLHCSASALFNIRSGPMVRARK